VSRFKLICEDEAIPFGSGPSKTVREFETEDLYEILTNATQFLLGCGYLSDETILSLGREVNFDNLDADELDEFTENLFTGTPIPKE